MVATPKKPAVPANAKVSPANVKTPKLSPLAQSVIDQISELDRAGKLTKNSKVSIEVNAKGGSRFGVSNDDEYAGESYDDPNEEAEFEAAEEPGVTGLLPQTRGKIGVYDESDAQEAEEGSMLESILNAVTKKVATPPLRNSKGQVSVIRMGRDH